MILDDCEHQLFRWLDVLILSSEEDILCIDPPDTLWRNSQVFSPLAISDGMIFALMRDSISYSTTRLVGVSIRTGEITWRRELNRVSMILADEETVFAACRSNLGQLNIQTPVKIIAMSISESAVTSSVWVRELPEHEVQTLSLLDDVIVASLKLDRNQNHADVLAGISATSGELLWEVTRDRIVNNWLPIAGNAVFCRHSEGLEAISLHDGSTIWSNTDSLVCDPAIRANLLFYVNRENQLISADIFTGKRIDSLLLPVWVVHRGTTISLANNGIYVHSLRLIMKVSYDMTIDWLYSTGSAYSMIIDQGQLLIVGGRKLFSLSD